jgi:hypothetical protein
MSAAAMELQQSTIREYTRQLHLPTLGSQFLKLAEEAVKQKLGHVDIGGERPNISFSARIGRRRFKRRSGLAMPENTRSLRRQIRRMVRRSTADLPKWSIWKNWGWGEPPSKCTWEKSRPAKPSDSITNSIRQRTCPPPSSDRAFLGNPGLHSALSAPQKARRRAPLRPGSPRTQTTRRGIGALGGPNEMIKVGQIELTNAKVPRRVRELLQSPDTELFLSVISACSTACSSHSRSLAGCD